MGFDVIKAMGIRLRLFLVGLFVTLAVVFEIRAQESYPVQPERTSTSMIKSAQVFPNPAVEFVNIRLEEVNVNDVKFSLHNLIGNKIEFESEIINEHEIRIKVKDLSTGYYLVTLKDTHSNRNGTLRFLKR